MDARIGCSGWNYRHWRGVFYPSDLATSQWFSYYSRHFDTVEINNSFYRLPDPRTFDAWRTAAPRGFLFAAKASRYLTHMKKLKDPVPSLDRFFAHARHLGRTLGPVLYQLPPHWAVNLDRLQLFLDALPRRRRHAIEFRDPSWYTDRVFAALERRGVALCLHDMAGSATGREVIGPFAYVRFHGTARYAGAYGDDQLLEWSRWCVERLKAKVPVFAYFNNDIGGHAPRDAARLRQAVDRLSRPARALRHHPAIA